MFESPRGRHPTPSGALNAARHLARGFGHQFQFCDLVLERQLVAALMHAIIEYEGHQLIDIFDA